MTMKSNGGQTIIEVLLAMAFSLIMLPALFTMFFVSREGRAQQVRRSQASALAVETQEALRSIRETGWDTFAVFDNGVSYHPTRSGNAWTLSAGAETVSGFTRSVVFSEVRRDGNGAIVASGGTRDPSTRRATVTVTWTSPLTASVTSVLYLTRHSSIVVTDTTDTDFNTGIQTNVNITRIEDGEVVLGSTGGYGDWCTPELTISALDLPKNGVANAVSAIAGQLAAGTGENASGVSYANVTLTDPDWPTNPSASISGTFDGFKTNDVFTEQNHAYLATDTNNKEVEIINLTQKDINGKYAEAGYFDAPGNGNASAVTTTDSTGYMTGGTKLYNFNLSEKTGSRPIIDSDGVTLPSAGTRMRIRGSRAFITTGSATAQLVIADISDPSNLSIAKTVQLPANGGTGLYVNTSGTRAYVTTGTSSTQREMFIINTDPTSPAYGSVLGSYDTGGMDPKGVVAVSGPRAIVVGRSAEEYQVVDITNENASPLPRCGGINIDSGVNGVDTVLTSKGRAYSYIITGDSTTELKIIEGGPGGNGQGFSLTGTFVSRIFDVTELATGSAMAAFNRISGTLVSPATQAVVTLQVAAADPVGGSCAAAAYTYVGPDGTGGTTFSSANGATITGSIPFSDDGTGFENPARCFRYKADFSTNDAALTPILKDVTVSYSP